MRQTNLTLRRPLFHLLHLCAALLFAAQFGIAAPDEGCKRPAAPEERFNAQGALLPGQTVERDLGVAEAHVYEVTLAAGQFFRAEVEQLGANVYVKLLSPGGETLSQFDRALRGKEPAECVADAAGVYRLEVHAFAGPPSAGRYAVRAAEMRPATGLDRRRAEVFKLLAEGIRLNSNRNGADYRGAIALNRKALAVSRELGED